MAYQYVTVDGQRVERNVAEDLARMNAAFQKAFPGIRLVVTSGTRTDAEQERIFRDRYVLAGDVRGRRVYDTRWWNGRLWYRVSSAGTVAVPGTSNHQESGPNGPRSIDIRDTGADAGVTVRGTRRDRWMQDNAHKYQFENEGYAFGEPWHKTYRGQIGVYPAPAPAGDQITPTPTPTPTPTHEPPSEEDDMPKNSGIYYDRTNPDGSISTVYLIFNTGSGFMHEFSAGPGRGTMPAAYNNALAEALDTPSWAKVTEGHARVIKRGLAAVTAREVSGDLTVTIDA